ncbi:MAPK regulated corepressor interacting protein 2-like [Schistocerca nitens]|uniref:MAPK regulated corepressor interacting protein 2-like n=1 Tax=Schistocerca nitens TaxID=7011 RepID=UPI0021184DF4|nr:MAPK regulated corepressor interacting protein 2-like [Schistocerca nitens]
MSVLNKKLEKDVMEESSVDVGVLKRKDKLDVLVLSTGHLARKTTYTKKKRNQRTLVNFNLPRPQMQSLNGKRPNSQRMQPDITTPQHDDLIKYICDSWNKVTRELENFSQNGSENGKGGPCVLYYAEQDTNPQLKDFEPFDLEAWWGQRVVKNYKHSQSTP